MNDMPIDFEALKPLSPHNPQKIRQSLLKKIARKIHEPEEKVRYYWIQKMVNEYGYNSNQIDINIPAGVGRNRSNVYADIVVFRDIEKTEPFIVGEVKKEGDRDGMDGEQGASYARNIGAEYQFWSNKIQNKFWKTGRFPNKSEPIGNIPVWVEKKPVIEKIKKTETLPPFRDVQELRQVVSTCHNIMHEEGHDPAYSFDELTKLLFLKIYDERETPNYYGFMALANETETETVDRINKLFRKATEDPRYRDVFLTRYNKVKELNIDLMPHTIYAIIQQLQGYSLVNTTENIQGADIKGTVYEAMVGNTFRGELGQYFTPRELVEFMVDAINPDKNDKILDPACGSGGFLIMCIRKVKERIKHENPNLSGEEINSQVKFFCEHNVYGLDINSRMARVSKMNMIMHGDGHAGIFNLNGLMVEKNMPRRVEEELTDESLDIVFSNPPFAGHESNPEVLKQFDLGKNDKGKTHSITPEVLFVERITRLLKVGGKAALVLPAGCFNNSSLKRLRDYIRANTKIIGLIGLPHLSFQVSGANNEGNLLFLEKVENVPEDYEIFIDWAEEVGFDATGRKTPKNDLSDILNHWKSPKKENIIKLSQLEERIDPWYYHPNYRVLKNELLKSGKPWERMGQIFTQSDSIFESKDYVGKEIRYLDKKNIDMEKGVIVSYSSYTTENIPTWAKFVLKEGDILFPRARDSVWGVTIVPKEYEGYIASGGSIVVRCNPEKILRKYVRYHFTKPEILALIKRGCSGEINPKFTWKLFSKIEIPLPSIKEQERILNEIEKVKKQKEALAKEIDKLDKEIEAKINKAVPKMILNRESIRILGAEFIGSVKIKKD